MTKRRAIALAVLTATGGAVAGWLVSLRFMGNFMNYSTGTAAVATLVVEGAALQHIHDGNADRATGLLESNLDGTLMTIGASVKAGFRVNPEARAAISRIKHLRESTGYAPTDPAVRSMVDDALALGR